MGLFRLMLLLLLFLLLSLLLGLVARSDARRTSQRTPGARHADCPTFNSRRGDDG